jgi:hypothetical protein
MIYTLLVNKINELLFLNIYNGRECTLILAIWNPKGKV